MADADLKRVGQIKGTGGSWAAGASAQDGYRAYLNWAVLRSSAPRGILLLQRKDQGTKHPRGQISAFPITGKQQAAYHQPGSEITGATNDPSDLNERILTLDSLMIADAATPR